MWVSTVRVEHRGRVSPDFLQQIEARGDRAVARRSSASSRSNSIGVSVTADAVARDRPPFDVDLDVAEPEALARRRPRAPQQRFDAREQLEDAERLGHVVVGAEPQAAHLVGFLGCAR